MRWAERCPSRSTPAIPMLGRRCITRGPLLTSLSPERCSADGAVNIPTVRGGAAAVQPSRYVFPPLTCSHGEGEPHLLPAHTFPSAARLVLQKPQTVPLALTRAHFLQRNRRR